MLKRMVKADILVLFLLPGRKLTVIAHYAQCCLEVYYRRALGE
jgi:hypothetical protein